MATEAVTSGAQLPPQIAAAGPVAWMKRNLFATPFDTILTILAVLFLAWVVPPLLRWAILDATISGTTPKNGRVAEPGFNFVAPGSGVIRMPPVSVCHHVSTIGQRLSPTTR